MSAKKKEMSSQDSRIIQSLRLFTVTIKVQNTENFIYASDKFKSSLSSVINVNKMPMILIGARRKDECTKIRQPECTSINVIF